MSATDVTVIVNGESHTVRAGLSLDGLLEGLGLVRRGIAIAVGDEVVPRSAWPARRLADGDRVEILTIAQGG